MQPFDSYLSHASTRKYTTQHPLGIRLGQALKARFRTQTELAEGVGVPRTRLYHWMRGHKTPTPADLDALARELRVDRRWLETGAGQMEIPAAGPQADHPESRIPADFGARPVSLNGDATSVAGDLDWLVHHMDGPVPEAKARGGTTPSNQRVNPRIGDATDSGPPAASFHPAEDRLVGDLLKTVREMAAVREMGATARELATVPGRKVELTLKSSWAVGASDPEFVVTVVVCDQA
jgi:transcriptional regulator with XRE-family HTH domain